MLSKKKVILSMIVNGLIFVITLLMLISYFFVEPNILIRNGFESFRYFTTDSNVFVALVSLVIVICDIRILTKKTDTLPFAVVILKYISTTCVMVTFLVTVCYLLPIYGPFVIGGVLFVVHVSTPLMAFFSFVLLENTRRIRISQMFLPMIPILLYAVVYYVEVNVIGKDNGGWIDFYRFNSNNHLLLTMVILALCCVGISMLVGAVYNLSVKAALKKQRSALPQAQDGK